MTSHRKAHRRKKVRKPAAKRLQRAMAEAQERRRIPTWDWRVRQLQRFADFE